MRENIHAEISRILGLPLFFIAATEKSGTTWMQMMLDAHPEIACRGEGQFATKLAPLLAGALGEYSTFVDGLNQKVFSETPGFPLFDAQDRAALVRTAAALLMRKYGLADGVRTIGEKTPGNIRALSALSSLFPGCRFVLMVRDIRDIVVSGHVHLRRQHGEAGSEPIANYARRVAKVWAGDVGRARDIVETRPDACIEVRYEDIHADPAAALRPVLQHLGVAAGDDVVQTVVEAGRFERLSGGRHRGEENAGSQFRKGIVGDWRHALPEDARRAVHDEAGAVMQALGYAESDDWIYVSG